MALLEEMQQSVTTDHFLSLIPVMLHPLYTACPDSSCPSLSNYHPSSPTSSMSHSPGSSDDKGRVFRTNSKDSRTYLIGKKTLPYSELGGIANSEPSPGTLSPCPFWPQLLEASQAYLGSWLTHYPFKLSSSSDLPLVFSFCKDWTNKYYFSGTFCRLGFCMHVGTKPNITQYPSQEPAS